MRTVEKNYSKKSSPQQPKPVAPDQTRFSARCGKKREPLEYLQPPRCFYTRGFPQYPGSIRACFLRLTDACKDTTGHRSSRCKAVQVAYQLNYSSRKVKKRKKVAKNAN